MTKKDLSFFDRNFGYKIRIINTTDFPDIQEKKRAVNQLINQIETLVNQNPNLYESRVLRDSPYKADIQKYHTLKDELEAAEWTLEYSLSHRGGTTQNFDTIIQTVKSASGTPSAKVTMLMDEIAAKRTPTRFSFTVIEGHQGPHTVARILGISIRQKIFEKLVNNNTLTIAKIGSIYAPNLTTMQELNQGFGHHTDYINKYQTVLNSYNTTTDIYEKIALGQMLVDLHPYATTFKIPSKDEIGGKGEGPTLRKWWNNTNFMTNNTEMKELVDWLSINNQVAPYKAKCTTYAKNITTYYKNLRKDYL